MCFVITKKLYDGRLSSTPLHTLIEKHRFYVLKVALQLYQSHLVEELCTPVDSMASVVCFTLAENGCLAGVGRTIFFNTTKSYRTSISSQTMCKSLHFKSSISQLLWHFLLQTFLVKWQPTITQRYRKCWWYNAFKISEAFIFFLNCKSIQHMPHGEVLHFVSFNR